MLKKKSMTPQPSMLRERPFTTNHRSGPWKKFSMTFQGPQKLAQSNKQTKHRQYKIRPSGQVCVSAIIKASARNDPMRPIMGPTASWRQTYSDVLAYSSWFASESEEAPPSDKRSASRVLSCSDSCSLLGMEFFFGRPLGLVGDSSPPPCNTLKATKIHISLNSHRYDS